MRFILYASLLFAVLPIVLYRPFFGLCVYYVVSILQPKILCWRGDFQDALLVGVPLVVGASAVGVQRKWLIPVRDRATGKLERLAVRFDRGPAIALHWIVVLFAALVIYIGVNRHVSEFGPSYSTYEYKSLCKIFLVTLLLTGLVTDYRRLKILFIVVAFSGAFWAIKGGIKVVLIGPHQVYGKSYDNNAFALVSVMSLPLVFYCARLVTHRKWRFVILVCAGLICLAIIGSRSRAGFAAFVVVLLMMAVGSRSRLRALAAVAFMVAAASFMAGPEIVERVQSIAGYREDKSASSRFYTWTIARTLFERNPVFGVGFGNFEVAKDAVFGGRKAAHSIYFSNMSELGLVGHPMWLLLLFGTTFSLWRFARRCRNLPPDMAWPHTIARGLMLSMIAFAIHGAFHNEEYLELMFTVVGMTVVLQVVTRHELRAHNLRQEARATAAEAGPPASQQGRPAPRIKTPPPPAIVRPVFAPGATIGSLARTMRSLS